MEIQEFLFERGLDASSPDARELVGAELNLSEPELEEYFGHGPLAAFFTDESVTEILVNGPAEIWVERNGTLERIALNFKNEESLRRYIRRLLSQAGRKVDLQAPFADAVLADGSRLHVAGPPIAKRGYCLSIRKFSKCPWSLARLEASGSLTAKSSALLRSLVKNRKNILVAGGTGTGKTSLLGALLGEVAVSERTVLLEDIAEIKANHSHLISLEARPANQEGEGEINLKRLLREALRMRPDRLVVGECRGAEALDLLLALNTGHHGSMATIHANSPREALARLETLALLAAENLREGAVKSLVAGSVQFVAQLARTENGRKLVSLAEIKGVDGEKYLLKELDLT
jgi:pilus assembly protein CpaF